MAKKETSTNVIRLLSGAKIAHEVREYDPEAVDGQTVAKELGEDPDSVFKSLVAENENHEHFIFEVPVDQELDLKKAAKATGSKWIKLIPQKELLPLTGYVHGGCSPIGLKKRMPCYMDETAFLFDKIFISAGRRGMQVGLSPNDLKAFVQADVVDLLLL